MKILTLILAATVLVLAVKPGIDLIALQLHVEESCCNGYCKPAVDNQQPFEQQQQAGDCHGNSCNPFQVCCSSVLYCLSIPAIEFSKSDLSTEQNFTYHTAFSTLFTTEFWQPPRFV